MIRFTLILLTATALTACADDARREFIYKPAYCLASGLAEMGSEECLPAALKEKAAAVATAKLKDATGEKPSEDVRVYYTDDQRLAMSYDIARAYFVPTDELVRSSAAMSLEAAGVIDPANADATCGADKARRDVINRVRDQMTDIAIHRDTARFLAEHYTDLQIGELYRAAQEGKPLADIPADAFLMPDAKDAKKTVNVKPKAGTQLGGILSFSTSRVASRLVTDQRKQLTVLHADRIKTRAEKACPPPAPEPEQPAAPEAAKEE